MCVISDFKQKDLETINEEINQFTNRTEGIYTYYQEG